MTRYKTRNNARSKESHTACEDEIRRKFRSHSSCLMFINNAMKLLTGRWIISGVILSTVNKYIHIQHKNVPLNAYRDDGEPRYCYRAVCNATSSAAHHQLHSSMSVAEAPWEASQPAVGTEDMPEASSTSCYFCLPRGCSHFCFGYKTTPSMAPR